MDATTGRTRTRRRFLQGTLAVGGAALLAACGPSATPAPPTKPVEQPASKPGAAATAQPTAAAKPTTAPTAAPAPAPSLRDVARNRTLIFVFGGREGKWVDYELWNPYGLTASHQFGANLMYEPLYYYSAFADEFIPWLAESHEYSPDYKTLTIKTRSGITWSDGKPFSAEDVAYTFDTLRQLGSKVRWGVDVEQFVDEARATDANTVTIKFKVPAPRFLFFAAYKFDIGIYIVPKHIFEGQEWDKFTHFDLAKGWPVTTGPWQVLYSSPDQKILDRRASWWAASAGLTKMPAMERLIYLPKIGESQLAQALITDQVDYGFLIVNTFRSLLEQNPRITTFSGRQPPYGYTDWWPLSLYVNCEKPPFDDPEIRWALSYFLDRKQIVDVAYGGAGSLWPLPLPSYPALRPYVDSVRDLLEQYDTLRHAPAEGADILTRKGWAKDGAGIWTSPDGQKLELEILGFSFMSNIGPVVAEQLKRNGVAATFSMPPDAGDRFTRGDYVGCIFGHGGSVADPYDTLRLYQSKTLAVPGQHQVNFPRWKNEQYDAIVDQVYSTPMEDKEKLKSLFRQAMEVWLPELPDIQLVEFYHNIARNETYWTGWPTTEDPYVNEASWHLTWQLVLNRLEPAHG